MMSAGDFLLVVYAGYGLIMAFIVAFLVKNQMTCGARVKCACIDLDCYLAGPSYDAMLFNPSRWTFAQHYPELAKRVKP